jgi:sensor c-di-GMP phosphodiesterase-like protein
MELIFKLLRIDTVFRSILVLTGTVLFIAFVAGGSPVIINKYKSAVEKNVDSFIQTADLIQKDAMETLSPLNEIAADKCTAELIEQMRTAQYGSNFAKDIGFSLNNELLCSTGLGILDKPFPEITPDVVTPMGFKVWMNVPIKLFNFQQVGTVVKLGNFNIVLNAAEFKATDSDTYTNAIFMTLGDGSMVRLLGSPDTVLPDVHKTGSWFGMKGFYASKCGSSNLICAVSQISMSKVLMAEKRLIFGVVMLSLLSSVFITIFLKNYLTNLIRFENRFLRNMNIDSLICYYQPVINLADGTIIGCEVLARWKDENGDIVPPDKFIPLVKNYKRTEYFTAMIIDKAFDEMRDIIKDNQSFKIAFNIFPVDFNYDSVNVLLKRYRTAYPDLQINIELTEDEIVEAPSIAQHINKLRKDGYIVSIDDFGTGYSSLSYLQEIKVDYIKIDRSFVKDLEVGSIKSKLIPHIVSITRTVDAGIIVEGVENYEQLYYLKGLGIEYAQGYLFSKPVPSADFGRLMKYHKKFQI